MMLMHDIWRSFRALPRWVQIWVAVILVPVNMASGLFALQPAGWLVAGLAIGGMLPNVVILLRERGLSKAMALPHVLIWTPLVVILFSNAFSPWVHETYQRYLWGLLAVNLISLGFDYRDAWTWWKGDRAIAK